MSFKVIISIFVLNWMPCIILATEGIRECPGLPAPNYVNIAGCEKAPCLLPRGKDAEMESSFTSIDAADKLKTRSYFREIESGVAGEFPLPSDKANTCDWLISTTCPIYPTEDVTFTLNMPVLWIYPKNMDLDLKITVENENKVILSCFQVLAKTV
uniref:CSON008571 protein n=1 Tax=Culicoides sonorensis TaxID=179676 RepID=A0A336MYS0_CULSO